MNGPDPFTPVPLSRRARPLILNRDQRATNIDEYIAKSSTDARVGENSLYLRAVIAVFLCAFAIIILRTAYLQVVRGSYYRSSSEQNRIRLEVIPASRGIILDKNLSPLLTNIPNFTLYAIPADLPNSYDERIMIADELVSVMPQLNGEEVKSKLTNSSPGSIQPVILLEHVDYQSAIRLTTAIARTPGVSLNAIATRHYGDGEAIAHLLGYLGKPSQDELEKDTSLSTLSQIGRMGVESTYDTTLRGKDGIREVERDHLNKQLSIVASRDPEAGRNVVLSIDKQLQDTLYGLLKDVMKRLKLPGASAVALDPRNGEVRALVSLPSFDPNIFTQGGSTAEIQNVLQDAHHPLVFRAIGGSYPSGSTIKPVIASAALAEKIVNEHTTVVSTGGIKVGPNFFPDWKSGGHGVTDVKKAIAESVNTFFYMVGGGFEDFRGLGVDKIVEYFKKFNLGSQLGIDLPGEAKGFVPDKEWREKPDSPHWYLGDTYNLSIGQGFINVTPLQVAAYTATIANGGTLYKPHLAIATMQQDGSTTTPIAPTVISSAVVPDRYLSIVRAGMRQAVTSGSARALSDLSVETAAKTGTAQYGNEGKTHAWFTCFAPYSRPELVITILLEGGGEGSATAEPIAKKALQEYFK